MPRHSLQPRQADDRERNSSEQPPTVEMRKKFDEARRRLFAEQSANFHDKRHGPPMRHTIVSLVSFIGVIVSWMALSPGIQPDWP
jgi:hypothetical protein